MLMAGLELMAAPLHSKCSLATLGQKRGDSGITLSALFLLVFKKLELSMYCSLLLNALPHPQIPGVLSLT